MNAFAVLIGGLTLAGPAAAQAPAILPVYGVTVAASGVTVRVPNSACTHKADFTAAISKLQPQALVLFEPKHPERCGPVAAGHAEIVYRWDELGMKPGESFILGNPLIAEP